MEGASDVVLLALILKLDDVLCGKVLGNYIDGVGRRDESFMLFCLVALLSHLTWDNLFVFICEHDDVLKLFSIRKWANEK